jgi:hypothetical protein
MLEVRRENHFPTPDVEPPAGITRELSKMRNRALENPAYSLLTTISSDLYACPDLKHFITSLEWTADDENRFRIDVKSCLPSADQFFQRLTGKDLPD